MYLVYNKILIVNCSKEVQLYKLENDEEEENPEDPTRRKWVNYQTIEGQGSLFYTKGNKRIQITSDEKI